MNENFGKITLSKGNPGALRFLELLDCYQFRKVLSLEIAGTDLYILWSDLCDKSLRKVEYLIDNAPKEIIQDACSRQDYSGIKLVEKYFKNYECH